jgi:hypothetical protein
MPKEAGASGVPLKYAILLYDMIYSKEKTRWQKTLVAKFCLGLMIKSPM